MRRNKIDVREKATDSEVLIPDGAFIMGRDDCPDNESPSRRIFLDDYYIDVAAETGMK